MNEIIYEVVGKKIGEFEDKDTKQKIAFGKLFCITVGCNEKGVEGEYDGCIVTFIEGANGKTHPRREIWHRYEPMKLFIRAVELSGLHIHWWEEWHWR